MEHTTQQYSTELTKSRLFPQDPLFWGMLKAERLIAKSHCDVFWQDQEKTKIHTLALEVRKLYVNLYREGYLAGYTRIKHETDLALEIIKDMNEILDDNCYTSGNTWLLWRLIYDEEGFHAVARKVCEQHEASLGGK